MTIELDSVSSVEFTDVYTMESEEREDDFHKSIFVPTQALWKFTRHAEPLYRSDSDLKVSKMMVNYKTGSNRPEGKLEGGIDIEWGGSKKDTQVNLYAKGELNDRNGNYARGQYDRKGDGSHNLNISGGHDTEKKRKGG